MIKTSLKLVTSTVSNTIRLLKLPAVIREDITAGKITMGHARALLSLETSEDQLAVREMIVKKKLSVRDTERKVAEYIKDKGKTGIAAPSPENVHIRALEEDLKRV